MLVAVRVDADTFSGVEGGCLSEGCVSEGCGSEQGAVEMAVEVRGERLPAASNASTPMMKPVPQARPVNVYSLRSVVSRTDPSTNTR